MRTETGWDREEGAGRERSGDDGEMMMTRGEGVDDVSDGGED